MNPCCRNCTYSLLMMRPGHTPGVMVCRRNPPVNDFFFSLSDGFIRVREDMWCGEWRASAEGDNR